MVAVDEKQVELSRIEVLAPKQVAGTNRVMRELGGVMGIVVLVAVFAGTGGYSFAQDFSDGFAPAVAVGAGLSLLGAICATALPSKAAAETDLAPALPALDSEA